MPAYQSDYLEFYDSIMKEVYEKKRIKVFERIQRGLNNFFSRMKYRINAYKDRIDRKLHPKKIRPINIPKRSYPYNDSCRTPEKIYDIYEPKAEKISLGMRQYGIMIDIFYKDRYINAVNYKSKETPNDVKRAIVNNIYNSELKKSFLLRLADFLHLN